MPWFGGGKKEENRYNQEGQWGHRQKVVDDIACGKSSFRSATITGLRMPMASASTLSMARLSVYVNTWPLRICEATNWPQSRRRRSEEHTSELQSPDHLV